MGLDGTLYDSEVKYSNDGSTWTQTTTDPFTEGGDAGDVIIFEMWDGHRAVVARISVSVHLAAEVAYTEDLGVTWHNIIVGAVVGQVINALWTEGGALYAACSGGDIYRSQDLADTWTRIATGVTANDLNDIVYYSSEVGYAVGDLNTFLYTVNGEDWFVRAGPFAGVNLSSVAVNDQGHVFVGATDGNLYRSEDGGVNWLDQDGVAGEWRAFGVGVVAWIGFDSDTLYCGYLIHNTPAPVGTIYRSFNGGATWTAPATGQVGAWNSGLNAGFICDWNHATFVGEAHDGLTMVAVVEPV